MDKIDVELENRGEKTHSPTAAISTSTESETFETWTLVTPELPTDRGKERNQEAKVSEGKNPKRHNIYQKDREDRNIENKKDETHTDGEISDGISIISDSESGGRSSPQPAPRRMSPTKRHGSPKSSLMEQSDEDNYSDNANGMSKSVIRTGYEPITPPNTPDANNRALSPDSITDESVEVKQNREHDNDSTDSENDRPLSMEINFTYAFLIAAFVAILAIFGRMKSSPMLDTKDLSDVYSKLNEILSKTNNIEAMIQDTMNGLDDRSFDQYSNMLTRMKELNEKFEKNNLAVKDTLHRLAKYDKYPALNPDSANVRANEQRMHNFNPESDPNAQNPVLEKPPKSNWNPQEKSRGVQNPASQYDNARRPQAQEQYNKKIRCDPEAQTPDSFESKDSKQKNNYKKRDAGRHAYNQPDDTDKRKEHYENSKRDAQRKPNSQEREAQRKGNNQEYDSRRKNGFKEKNTNSHYKENNYNKISDQQEDDWMERRRMSREDARKAGKTIGDKHLSDEDSNWYLERGSGRQKARRYEKVDDRA